MAEQVCKHISHDDCVIMSGQNLYTPVVELALHLSCFSVLGTDIKLIKNYFNMPFPRFLKWFMIFVPINVLAITLII